MYQEIGAEERVYPEKVDGGRDCEENDKGYHDKTCSTSLR